MDKDKILKHIGNNIKNIRESKGISQQKLAADCNFEKSNMSRIEAGKTNPTILTLYKIANALDVDVREIFGNI
ncbi:MAG: helix-turn-helix transcriptional regulator [Saprospiraceae bacterium]|nr:helix-turn-helix transcriptional regulator [Saprospiraceae bacterium]